MMPRVPWNGPKMPHDATRPREWSHGFLGGCNVAVSGLRHKDPSPSTIATCSMNSDRETLQRGQLHRHAASAIERMYHGVDRGDCLVPIGGKGGGCATRHDWW